MIEHLRNFSKFFGNLGAGLGRMEESQTLVGGLRTLQIGQSRNRWRWRENFAGGGGVSGGDDIFRT